jgi:hypothetical protein
MPPKIALPEVGWVEITGDQGLFDAFDLRNSGICSFRGASSGDNVTIDISYFRDQTTEVSLEFFELNQKPVQPRHFKDLTLLNLESTRIHGTLGEYLLIPSLKFLVLAEVEFKKPENTGPENHNWTRRFSDTRFLQGSPLLEAIEMSSLDIEEYFIEGLKSCTALKTLELSQCDLDRFISPFLECLESSELVPSLNTFEIHHPWSTNADMTFEEFGRRFIARRPNVHYRSTGHWEPPAPSSPSPL